jgi:hypothetical protein
MSSLIDEKKEKGQENFVSSDQYDLSPKDSASDNVSGPAKVHEDEIKDDPPTEK